MSPEIRASTSSDELTANTCNHVEDGLVVTDENGSLEINEVAMLSMPAELYGLTTKQGGFTLSEPRQWTSGEIVWVNERLAEGHTVKEIADAIGRTKVSVSLKVKRQSKIKDTYNEKHREMKYAANQRLIDVAGPKSVLDVFAGNSYYLDRGIKRVVTNDLDEKFNTDYHEDALKLLCRLYANGDKFDIIDLDPYGSAYDCIDLAIKMASKGLAISFGEWGHLRWRRYDYVRPRYGIAKVEDFTQQAFIDELTRIAATNKKKVEVLDVLKYGNFLRVYCTFTPLKTTEQWEK
jgi:N2,N2-dimethylguanosine tRNA methyltransferase